MNKVICQIQKNEKNQACFVESKHIVSALVVDENENIIFQSVSKNDKLCLRSTFKPFQAIPTIKNKINKDYNMQKNEIALLCASHSGEKTHIQLLKKMMKKMQIDPSMFLCGIHKPYSKQAKDKLIEDKTSATVLHNNCSGKHLGMIITAKHLNYNISNYIDIDHPIQKQIANEAYQLTNESPDWIIDGCSVPSPIITFLGLAKLYLNLGMKKTPELKIINDAIVSAPHYLAGTNRFDSDFICLGGGDYITKGGAESVRGLTMKTKKYGQIAMALKVNDGHQRANVPATIAILKHLNCIDERIVNKMNKHYQPRLYNHNKIHVGQIKVKIQ